jgi:hypothetical protein
MYIPNFFKVFLKKLLSYFFIQIKKQLNSERKIKKKLDNKKE